MARGVPQHYYFILLSSIFAKKSIWKATCYSKTKTNHIERKKKMHTDFFHDELLHAKDASHNNNSIEDAIVGINNDITSLLDSIED